MIPEPYELALLALAAGSLWKLVGDDRILDRPRDWLLGRMRDADRQTYWGDFLVCPWCAGAWVSLIVYVGWLWVFGEWPDSASEFATGVVVWLAIRALVGLFGVVVDALQAAAK